jgi:hypothetical protein
MTVSRKPQFRKFQKKDSICNICQQEKVLSIDHVPPQACPPAKSRVTSKLLYQMIGDTSFGHRQDQNGVTFKTISCFAFKLSVKKQSNSCGVGVPPASNMQFKCATAYALIATIC